MKIIKHYETRGGKYAIKAELSDDGRVDIIEETNGQEQGRSCNNVYLQGIFKFDRKVTDSKVINGINYCNKVIDLLY